MKIVIQRVSSASVKVKGEIKGSIQNGLLLLVGVHHNDTKKEADWCIRKIGSLRIFEDETGKMNRSVIDVEGSILIVSQFTLYGDVRKGTRPSFIEAAKPDKAEPLYDYMIEMCRNRLKLPVETGVFGEMMQVELVNNGPVTIILER